MYNLTKLFKVQIIGILEEIDSFIDRKCTYEKVPKNWARPPPLSRTNSKKREFFLRRPSLNRGQLRTFIPSPKFESSLKALLVPTSLPPISL